MDIITVTANKIEENIQDVPKSITVIDETLIEAKGIKDISDIVNTIPNTDFVSSSNIRPSINIRGLNTSLFTNNIPMVMYIDGIAYSDSYSFTLSLANIERIEVLRGPQGTLYAKDAIGGVINVVTKEPTNEWSGKVGAEYGTFDYRDFSFNGSGAIVEDVLYLGLNGQYRADNGWITNNVPGTEEDANKFEDRRLSTYLLYRPTEKFRAKFTYSNDYTESFGVDGYAILGGSSFSDFDRDVAENQNRDFDTEEEIKIDSQALQLAYDFENFTVASVTTRRYREFEGFYDFDEINNTLGTTSFQFDDQELETWTQEFTLKSNKSEGLRYVAGIYLETSEREQGPYGEEFFGTNFNAESTTDTDTAAIFGQVIYPVFDVLELTLGGRYQRIEKEIDLDSFFNNALFNTVDGDEEWTEFLPKVALNYKVNDNWSVYASYTKGYMPGGFNFFAFSPTFTPGPLPLEDNTFEPQVSDNYEIGVKVLTERMTLGAAFFYIDIEDIHVFRINSTGQFLTENEEKAYSLGAELEMTYQLTQEFEVSASVGLIDTEYETDNFRDGEKIEQTPDYTINLGAAYYHPTGLYGRADLNLTGETSFLDAANQPFQTRDSYTVLDTRIGYLFGDWEIYAYVKNLTDEEYITGYRARDLPGLGIWSEVAFNDPRTFGIGARYSF